MDVSIAMRNDNVMQVQVYAASSARPFSDGLRRPPLHSAAGQAFLATRTHSEARRIIDRAARFRKLPKDRVQELVEDVDAVRERGYARCHSVFFESKWTVAIPLPVSCGSVDLGAVLALTGDTGRLQAREERIVAMMRGHAEILTGKGFASEVRA
jgi:DNA-binding IclR family transcriptional regulator